MKQHGFTVVELVIVITLMGILMGLGTFSIIDSQSHARDTERKSDIEIIAMNLENLYQSGNYDSNDESDHFKKGRYPSTIDMTLPKTLLRDLDIKSLDSPGKTGGTSLQVATDTFPLPPYSPADADIGINDYIYLPLKNDGALCENSDECRKFILYAWLENQYKNDAGDMTNLYTIESKNQ